MSCNYADGLSPYNNKGKLGIPEIFDDASTVETKIEKLAEWIKAAKHVVVHTGAGISTAAGIPDFRGPNGVWTLEEKGLKPNINISFDLAKPTLTHMALAALIDSGHVKYLISQNIDGLHVRSGLKRVSISELHGNMFVAKCSLCDRQFIQKSSVPTVGQKEIGAECPWIKSGGRACRGKLHDTILDWEHALPERDLEMADMHSSLADLSICLGTTLQIVPAGNLPLRAKKNNGKVVIVNLQPTKHHKKSDLVIHTQVDRVMAKVAELLGVRIPPFSSHADPTTLLRQQQMYSVKIPLRFIDWTIPMSTISKLKKMISDLKNNSSSSKSSSASTSKPKIQRKRRRAEHDDTSESEDDDEQDPSKGNNLTSDFQSFIQVKTEQQWKREPEIYEHDMKRRPNIKNYNFATHEHSLSSHPTRPSASLLPLDLSIPHEVKSLTAITTKTKSLKTEGSEWKETQSPLSSPILPSPPLKIASSSSRRKKRKPCRQISISVSDSEDYKNWSNSNSPKPILNLDLDIEDFKVEAEDFDAIDE